jgi:hypothetical protein
MQQTNQLPKNPNQVSPNKATPASKPVLLTLSDAELRKVRGGTAATRPTPEPSATAIE